MEKLSKYLPHRAIEGTFFIAAIGILFLIVCCIFSYFDIRGVESNVIYSIQLALHDNSLLYHSPESPPFNITQYSPLYYILNDGLISLLPVENTEFFKIRIITRLTSIITLVIALFYLRIILQRFLNIDKKNSNIVCLLFIIFSFPWFNISRPDVLVLLFFILSMYSILSYTGQNKKAKYAIFLGAFLSLGLMSKLTMAIIIIALGFYMLLTKNWRLIFISFLSFTLSSVLFFYLLWILNYDFVYLHENIY